VRGFLGKGWELPALASRTTNSKQPIKMKNHQYETKLRSFRAMEKFHRRQRWQELPICILRFNPWRFAYLLAEQRRLENMARAELAMLAREAKERGEMNAEADEDETSYYRINARPPLDRLNDGPFTSLES